MKRTTIFIDESMERELVAQAERERRPKAALVREAVGEYLARRQRGRRELGFAAIGRSGRGDTAERHEELLWQGEAPADGPRQPPPGYLPPRR